MTKKVVNGVQKSEVKNGRLNIPHSFQSQLSQYFAALRPWSFTASFTPVALGSTLAFKTSGTYDLSIFLVICLTALSVHAAGNLVNTYFDYTRGIDSKKSDDRTLVDRLLSPADVAFLGGVFYVMGCVGFLLLAFLSPAKMEHIALIYFGGLSSSFLYTGGMGLKYIAMGDLVIFFTFGPLTVMFAFLCQAGQLSLSPFLYAIPLALNTVGILHSNNTRDMESDKSAGIMTIAILLGRTGSYLLFAALLFVPYIVFIMMSLHCTKWMLLPVLSVFLAFRYEREFRSGHLLGMPKKMALLNLFMGVMYVCACFMADKSTLPNLLL
ncbi:ubiA prenyltransferase domain-containing protein 1-like [Haliotis cracherodii]|uniref:ubiA prenyltransferase domain-containing protein 1-like n=1 Tax=Haliotis cracherodii TaxID=6455 RepID=UPI0039E9FD1D